MKSKQKRNRIQSERKKFSLFGYGKKFRIVLANIIMFLIICTRIGICIQQNKIAKSEIEINEMLQLFIRIDDLAHQQFAEMEARGNPSGFTGFEEFDKIDNNFHMAETLKEKYIEAKKMDIFFHDMDIYLHKVGGLTSTGDLIRDKEYHTIDKTFDTLQINF